MTGIGGGLAEGRGPMQGDERRSGWLGSGRPRLRNAHEAGIDATPANSSVIGHGAIGRDASEDSETGGPPVSGVGRSGREVVLEARLSRRVHPGLIVDAAVEVGREIAVLFGRSGAGKTTLLRMIAGLERPDLGSVRLGGRTLFDSASGRSEPLRNRRVGMIFQHDLLFPHLGVRENVRFGLAGWPRRRADDRVEEVSALCEVSHLLGRRPETLSGGERQRVGMARTLAPRPELLLCDEPFSALDLEARDALVDRLRRVQQREGVPVLYVTHSPAEAIALGDRLLLLDSGRIRADGPPLDVLAGRSGSGSPGLVGVRNVMRGTVLGHEGGSTRVAIEEGPELIVPRIDGGVGEGSGVVVSVRADDILLARGPVEGLSARNLIAGEVERIVLHGGEAEVVVASGRTRWIVSVVQEAVAALALQPGVSVRMIVKARSCRVSAESAPDEARPKPTEPT